MSFFLSWHINNMSVSVMTDKDRHCLADLLLTDPRSEKIRIERTKGGLLNDSFHWILGNSEFQSCQLLKRGCRQRKDNVNDRYH